MDPNEVQGVWAAHATDRAARTGCTALVFPLGAAAGVHVPGSATGTRELGVLVPGHLARRIHGVVLSGGSAFGLATADGAMAALAEAGVGLEVLGHTVPIVPAAILFDLSVATRRPTAADGRAAAEAALARPQHLPEGAVGAGTGATVAKATGRPQPGGLGVSGAHLGDVRVSAVVACNAVGSIRDANGDWLAGEASGGDPGAEGANTTLVVVVTDAALDREQCTVVAKMASAGLARAIEPAFLPFDGDIVFCAATGAVAGRVSPEALAALGHGAAEAVADAVRRGVRAARS